MKKSLLWITLQNKRLLSKISFLLLLICIPLTVISLDSLMKEENGAYRVVLCREDKGDTSKKICERLASSKSVILFSECDDREEALEMITSGECDAVWIFPEGIDEKIEKYCADETGEKPIISVIERERTVSSLLSHEKLYAAVYPEITYKTYKNYVFENIKDPSISEKYVNKKYNDAYVGDGILSYSFLESVNDSNETNNYLNAPIRGFLAIIIILCGLSAQMFFFSDKENGIYDLLGGNRHIFANGINSFIAVTDAGLAALISMMFSSNATTFFQELFSIICFIPAAVAFCMLMGLIFRTHRSLGIGVPFITLVLLVASPVFLNLDALNHIQMLFPPYYYLNSLYGIKYNFYSLIYSLVVFALIYIIFLVKKYILRKN